MTAYRQEALSCAAALATGAKRPRDLKPAFPRAPQILLRNVYGWFHSPARGLYELTPAGFDALRRWPQAKEADDPTANEDASATLPES